MCFVVDANAIHAFQKDRIHNFDGIAINAISGITLHSHIALDIENLCYQEWLDCAGGKDPYALADWISDQLVSGGIKLYNLSDNSCRRELTKFGIPQKDHKWIRLAIGSNGKKIVTDDIDFFDPTAKKASSHVKDQIKASRNGPCARSLRKTYDIRVMCLFHVKDELT